MGEVTTLIGSLGFPIFACVAMGMFINNTMKQFTEVIQQNTMAINKLVSIIDKEDK